MNLIEKHHVLYHIIYIEIDCLFISKIVLWIFKNYHTNSTKPTNNILLLLGKCPWIHWHISHDTLLWQMQSCHIFQEIHVYLTIWQVYIIKWICLATIFPTLSQHILVIIYWVNNNETITIIKYNFLMLLWCFGEKTISSSKASSALQIYIFSIILYINLW